MRSPPPSSRREQYKVGSDLGRYRVRLNLKRIAPIAAPTSPRVFPQRHAVGKLTHMHQLMGQQFDAFRSERIIGTRTKVNARTQGDAAHVGPKPAWHFAVDHARDI